jgi:hypothetical protein
VLNVTIWLAFGFPCAKPIVAAVTTLTAMVVILMFIEPSLMKHPRFKLMTTDAVAERLKGRILSATRLAAACHSRWPLRHLDLLLEQRNRRSTSLARRDWDQLRG